MIHLTWSTLIYFVVGILGIDIMVMVHEMGHFFACRLFGVRVESVSIGFGKPIRRWKSNDTEFRLCIIPFGGSTKMAGQEDLKAAIATGRKNMDTSEHGSIYSATALQRILIYLAGPLFNIILSMLCFTIFLCMPSRTTYYPPKIVLTSDYRNLYNQSCPEGEAGLRTGDVILTVNGKKVSSYSELSKELSENKDSSDVVITTDDGRVFHVKPDDGIFGILPFREPVVGSVSTASPEQQAGLKHGDVIIKANNADVTNMFDILSQAKDNSHLVLTVLRNGEQKTISFKTDGTLNFTLQSNSIKTKGIALLPAIKESALECFQQTKQFFSAVISLIKGQSKLSQTIGGTIYASENIGMMATHGFEESLNKGVRVVLYVIGSVSLSLAMANFIPITALDGGLILISFCELVANRTFSPKAYITLQAAGLITIFIVIPVVKLFF